MKEIKKKTLEVMKKIGSIIFCIITFPIWIVLIILIMRFTKAWGESENRSEKE